MRSLLMRGEQPYVHFFLLPFHERQAVGSAFGSVIFRQIGAGQIIT